MKLLSNKQVIKFIFLASLVQNLNAISLKDIIHSTLNSNQNLKSQDLELDSSYKSYQSTKNIFHPTLNVGVNYQKLDKDLRNIQIGTTTTSYVKFGLNLYDGGKSIALKNQKKYQYQSNKYNNVNLKKETILQVVTLYFNIKTVIDNIKVYQEKAKTLQAEYQRIKDKYNIKMATKDEVLKLKAEYDSNNATIEELQYQKEDLMQNLQLISKVDLKQLDLALNKDYKLPDIVKLQYHKSPNIKSLELLIKASNENINNIASISKPFIKIEDNLNFYEYDDYNKNLLTDLPDTQNQLMVTLNLNLFDSSTSKKIQSAKASKFALEKKLEFLISQEKMKFNLAKRNLQTQELKIKALKSAAQMGESVYEIVKLKYQNGIVDYITYLDALSKKIYNQALYTKALNDLEIAKANYYFASGIDYHNILNNW